LKPSVVKTNRVFTINSELIKRVMGQLPDEDLEQIKIQLVEILNLKNAPG